MQSQGFPDSHTTTVTSTTTKTAGFQFDPSYLRTVPGLLKVAQLVISLIGFICSQIAAFSLSTINWYGFVSMTAFWVTLVLLLFYLFHLIERIKFIPWLLAELIYCGVWALLYFTAAVAAAVKGKWEEALAAAAFFGFVAMALYGADAFFKYKGWKAGDVAQGERTAPGGVGAPVSGGVSPTSPGYPAY
ncbi:CKLF-like MARVEL transmembrane domain-containing protein 4 isoform X2 [Ornithodoros turicata]|uniref:Putative chemokine-like factor superfamily 4 protein n=2 Tax=Ornithodoros turicata TaxID=34597 RepID=A0A2R5L6S4_9ACAR